MARRTSPADLGDAGRGLFRRIETWRAEVGLRFDPHELILVDELARTADRLATLRDAIGTTSVHAAEWVRLAGEERQQRLAFARLVSSIGLPTGVVPEPAENVIGMSARSRRGQRAARARWGEQQNGRANAS